MRKTIKTGPRTRAVPRHNTSGVSCLRLRQRRERLVIDVTWYDKDGRLRSTSVPATSDPVTATERAMARRAAEAGVVFELSPRQVWNRLKRSFNARQHTGVAS